MSRSDGHARGKRVRYDKEDKSWRKIINRRWRRQGKRLGEDAPPQRGTQGWNTH